MPEKWTTERVVKEFGPIKQIDRARESELMQSGKWRHVLTLVSHEVGYLDLPEEDRPSDQDLKDQETTKEDFTTTGYTACVGHHIVNVSEIFETAKPMPEDLEIPDDEIRFDDDGLPN